MARPAKTQEELDAARREHRNVALAIAGASPLPAASIYGLSQLAIPRVNLDERGAAALFERLRAAAGRPDVAYETALGRHVTPHFDPTTRRVVAHPSQASPAVLAHELGHASPTLLTARLQQILSNLGPIAAYAYGLVRRPAEDETVTEQTLRGGGGGAAIGAVTSAPRLFDEGRASLRGLRYIRKAGLGRGEVRKALRTLVPAFGTYAVPAVALPAALGATGALMQRSGRQHAQQQALARARAAGDGEE